MMLCAAPVEIDQCVLMSLTFFLDLIRYEMRIHKRLIDLHSPSEVVKQIVCFVPLYL